MKRLFSTALLAAVLGMGACAPALADTPLLQEGKKTVYQRLVSHPGAVLYEDSEARRTISNPRTFTTWYVYGRKGDMVRVGVSATRADGWMKAERTTEWPQAITMVFTDQMGRQPVLFFRSHEAIEQTCSAPSVRSIVDEYVRLLGTPGARIPHDSPVIATEPPAKEGQVSQKDFYLLPVLNFDTKYMMGGDGTQLLEVACLDPGVQELKRPSAPKAPEPAVPNVMKVGLVFVIDTTKSMKPYIEQTRSIIRDVFNRIWNSPARDLLSIAVVGFRSNVEMRPKTEYNTRIISDFTDVKDRAQLDAILARVDECHASTHAFDEDSLAGVKAAVDSLSWDRVQSKAIMLVTDAGPLSAGDPASKTGMSPEAMADYLRANHIYLTAVHIKTPLGRKDHAYAEKSYRELSRMTNGRSVYLPIDAATPSQGAGEFRRVGGTVADTYRKVLEKLAAGAKPAKPEAKEPEKEVSVEELAARQTEAIGYAMQLQFAGDTKGTRAPQVVRAWIADADLSLLEESEGRAPVPVVYPAVLLTKLQLSQLRSQVKTIIETAEQGFHQGSTHGFNFFDSLQSALAVFVNDPKRFAGNPGGNLAQRGLVLEVLDGLPYHSRILGLRRDDWTNMSTGEQFEFIKRLKGLVRRYEEYDRDNEHWESFGSPNANEWVYRVPLDMLP